jgi:polysaccharide biosynthesis transport protein
MSLHQFLSILRARRGVAGLILLSTLLLALVWVLIRPASYMAKAPVLVDIRMDPVASTPYQGLVAPSFMTTQIDIIKSDRVAERVVKMLPKDQPPLKALAEQAAKKPNPDAWLAHAIQQRLEVKPARESNIINITWTGRTPAEAARVANAFAQAYLDTSLDIKTDPAKKYADWFEGQVQASREKLERAQNRLSEFQMKAGILSPDEKGDFETERLKELSAQLLAAQGRGRSGGSVDAESASVGSPLVNNLRAEVARMEAKVQESAANLGSRHPQMQALQAQLGAMRSRLSSETERVGHSANSSAASSRARQRELEQALTEQKQRVLTLNKSRGELTLLQRDVDTAQKAFETVSASAAQSKLQSMTTQTNVMRLASAVEPMEKTGPSGMQALMIAAVAGTILGIAGALLLELGNRRIRSADDLAMVTHLPILASVPGPRAIGPLRLAGVPRLALASSRSLAT